MKISTKGEYGIRAMLHIAGNRVEGLVTSGEIAAKQDIPAPYLRRILALLSKAGLIRSVRGPQGGHRLARPAGEISLRDILLSLEGHTTSVDQILDLPCSIELGPRFCAIREVWLEIKEAVDGVLASTTLEMLAWRQEWILEEAIEVPLELERSSRLTNIGSSES